MPKENDGLSEFEQDLFKSLDELNKDIDRTTEILEDNLDDFDPEGFLKGVSHEDTWGDEDDEDKDFGLEGEDEEGDEGEEEEEEVKKKKKKAKKGFDGGNLEPGQESLAKGIRALKIKPDPRLTKILHNQVVLGNLLKSLCETVSSGMRQIANLADAQGLMPRKGQDTGRIGGQASSVSGLPEEVTKAIGEVGFIGDAKQREKAIDEAFAKGLLPDGLTDISASTLYREDPASFVKTVAPVLVQMRREATKQG